MSEQETEKSKSSSSTRWAVVVAILIALVAIIVLNLPSTNGPNPAGGTDGMSGPLLELNQALAATENMETAQAAPLWESLRKEFPDDPSVALNAGLNAVLRVDSLTAQATDGNKTKEEQSAARGQLGAAIADARVAVDQYAKISGDEVTKVWLASRVDSHEATLVPAMSKSLRRNLFTRLIDALAGPIGDDPRAIILGGPLTELLAQVEDPDASFGPGSTKKAAAALAKLSDNHPDNLFLAMNALMTGVDVQDKKASRFVDRMAGLVESMRPTLVKYIESDGSTMESLAQRLRQAIADGKWQDSVQPKFIWRNILTPLEIMRTDRRRTMPHPLDRLSFDTLRRLSAEAAEANPLKRAEESLQFANEDLQQNANVAIPIDWDVDLDTDIATVDGDGVLTIWNNDLDSESKSTWTQSASLKLDFEPTGMIATELFMVDSSNPERLKRDGMTVADDDTKGLYAQKVRHDVIPGIVLFGKSGVRLVAIDSREKTEDAKRLTLVDGNTGLQDLSNVHAVIAGDMEGDGDVDLVVSADDGIHVFINRGTRTFFESKLPANGFDVDDPATSLAIADLDRDLDLDVVTVHAASGRVGLLENLLHLQFRTRYLDEIPASKDAHSVLVADVDGNIAWDIIIASKSESALAFGRTADVGVWNVERVETGKGFAGACSLADLDNDTFPELVGGGSVSRLGPWGIVEPTPLNIVTTSSQPTLVGDVNIDGKLDLLSAQENAVVVSTNTTPSVGHHLTVRFRGISDNAESSGRVNHYAIGSVLELRFGPHYRAQIVTSPATHFGLDGLQSASNVRIIMPNGLTQTIAEPTIDVVLEEEQSLKGSCPYLYCWDGEKFAFATDCLWAAPLGLQVAQGVVARDRPWEYLKVDGDLVQARDGQYELRITEELWEVAYIDHLELTAVDHPDDVDIWTNEKVGPASIATPTIYSFDQSQVRQVTAALDTQGNDVTDLLRESDQQFVQGFEYRLRQGLCPPHWIDMDFTGQVPPSLDDQRVYLVLRGWILPTDSSLNIQIDQNPELPRLEFPSLWVPDSSGQWQRKIESIGFPGGKTKTIVVDVTDAINTDDPRLRVRTSAQIYWDSAMLSVQSQPAEIKPQTCSLASAEVAQHGFSQKSQASPRHPEVYDYQITSSQPRWAPLRGKVTQLGDCDPLIRSWDDQMVVISGGDEIRVRFNVPPNPVPAGWKRDFVLHCVGWDKDADLNTLTGQSIGPLPMREMQSYPPTMQSQSAFDAVESLNATHLNREQSFREFWYRPTGLHDELE
ncbi:FG-GAP repeat domain-containing protein [Stieleria varia]|uniref:FG-GAP repeat domain-containing protein n=1 Tax=Stieleria varia TaxID=2528005 RepID=UPI001E4494B6|nr:VCBS repeat-containing protein [Stieleria varia]